MHREREFEERLKEENKNNLRLKEENKNNLRTFLVVQWLTLCASTAGGMLLCASAKNK